MFLNLLFKWHRFIGFFVAIFVIFLSISGIMLNHTSALGLGKRALPAWITANAYGASVPLPTHLNGLILLQESNGEVVVNGHAVAHCANALVGAVEVRQLIVVVCSHKLIFLSSEGELLEEQGQSLGVPMPIFQVAVYESNLMLKTTDAIWQLNPESLDAAALTPVEKNQLNTNDQFFWLANESSSANIDLSVERLLLDLHSGRLMGGWGVWLMDIVALGLITLTITGYLAWREKQRLLNEE